MKTRVQKRKKTKHFPTRKKKTISPRAKKSKLFTWPAENPRMNIRVSRFNPTIDFTPRTHEYSIHAKPGESILDLLTRIKHTQDGSLTFRGSCGYGGCGSCGVKVNGKPLLGCVTQVKDVLDTHNAMRIDPLDAENTIKDLVVDEKAFFEELLRITPWLTPRAHDERRNNKMGVSDVQKLGNAQQCILCGLCNASAESSSRGELGPAAFVKAYRYVNDMRDANTKRASEISSNLPVHYSLDNANVCPRNIFPGDKIREMREIQKARHPSVNERKRKT